jgi:DnaK suppressor protein
MTRTEVSGFKDVLETKRRELECNVRNRDGIAIETATEVMDQVVASTDRELAISNLNRKSALLRNVCNALRRIQEDSFGVCIQCEENINIRRLNAVPWTPYCISCQEIADRQNTKLQTEFDEIVVR